MSFKNRFTLLMICALMLTGCAQLPKPVPPVQPLQASLRQQCEPLPQLDDGRRAAVLKWAVEVKTLYAVCSSRLRRVLEARP